MGFSFIKKTVSEAQTAISRQQNTLSKVKHFGNIITRFLKWFLHLFRFIRKRDTGSRAHHPVAIVNRK